MTRTEQNNKDNFSEMIIENQEVQISIMCNFTSMAGRDWINATMRE